MKDIQFQFEEEIHGYVVRMPHWITFEMLKTWTIKFDATLRKRAHTAKFSLLIDTGGHEFETVDCMKFLRKYLTDNPAFRNMIAKGAFVAPATFVTPHVQSNLEAYFNDFDTAYEWIKTNYRGGKSL